MARLHHERIAHEGATPAWWLLLTHGIFGAGSNWRGIARRLTDRRPTWGVVLVDLRHHGRSEGGSPPNDVAACAGDLAALLDEMPVRAIAGHSFGGKVVLATRLLASPRLAQTWVLDASPSPRSDALDDPGNTVAHVLALMERLPKTWARRDDFTSAIVADGHEPALASWLAMNLVPQGDQLVLRLDLAAVREMLADYYARDLWEGVLRDGPGDVELVIADRSRTISAADRARLATAPPHVHVHHIDAGHWLHIEAADAVIELFATRLP